MILRDSMVCKEEVCDWFTKLSGSKRIDLMCGLLHVCLPLELRFLGSCVENLARKDFINLRECELEANSSSSLKKLSPDIFDARTRSYLNIYLALLYSTNYVCSSVMFDILTHIEPSIKSATEFTYSDTRPIAEDIVLLLTMAAHHPAFTFIQKQKLYEHLKSVEQILSDYLQKEIPVSPHYVGNNINGSDSSPPEEMRNQSTQNPMPVYVKNIELKGSHLRPSDRRAEFRLQVTWSDGEISEACRTYQELYNFHVELIKLFPGDSGAHKQKRHLPFFPQEKSPLNNQKHMFEQIRKYIRELSTVPEHIIQCDHVTLFFKVTLSSSSRSSRSTSTSSSVNPTSPLTVNNNREECVPSDGPMKTLTVYNTHILNRSNRSSPVSDLDDIRRARSPGIPTAHCDTIPVNHRHSYSTVTSYPSPLDSPLPSPLSSPYVSPSCIPQSGIRAESPPQFELTGFLKRNRLHKYYQHLNKYSLQQLMALTEKDMEKIGLTVGARKKFRAEIQKPWKELKQLNGICSVESTGRTSSPALVQVTWHSPLTSQPPAVQPKELKQLNGICSVESTGRTSSPALVQVTWHSPLTSQPPAVQHMGSKWSLCSSLSITGSSVDSSPTCSEYSSPPASPGLPKQPEESHAPAQADKGVNTGQPDNPPALISSGSHAGVPQGGAPEMKPNTHWPGYPPPYCPSDRHKPFMEQHLMHNFQYPHMVRCVGGPGLELASPQGPPPLMYGARQPIPPIRSPRPQGAILPMPNMQQNVISSPKIPNSIPVTAVTDCHVVKGSGMPDTMTTTNTVAKATASGMTTTESVTSYKVPQGFPPMGPPLPPYQGLGPPHPPHRPNSLRMSLPPTAPQNNTPCTLPVQLQGTQNKNMPLVSSTNMTSVTTGYNPYPASASNAASQITLPTPAPVTPIPTPSPTPPSVPVLPLSNSGCSSCGCSGQCSPGLPTTTYQFNYPMWPPSMMPPGFPVGNLMQVTSNNMISPSMPSMPFPPPPGSPFNVPNGLPPDVMCNNQINFALMQSSQQPNTFMGAPMHLPQATRPHSSFKSTPDPPDKARSQTTMCCNCGKQGHTLAECNKSTMDDMNQGGVLRLNYIPKADT